MDKEVLKRYFEQTSTSAENDAVEDWMLDPVNKVAFEQFLEEKWSEHMNANELSDAVQMKKTKMTPIWKAVSAAALLVVTFGAYQWISSEGEQPQPVKERVANIQSQPAATPPISPIPQNMSDTLTNVQPKTVQHEKKKDQHQSKIVATKTASANSVEKNKSVQATKLENFKINERQLAKLVGKIDSNQLVFDVDIPEVTFQRLAYLLHKEYGIILELCDNAETSRTYSARFEKISIHDLLDDMSEKMLFSYTFQDNKVKICFN